MTRLLLRHLSHLGWVFFGARIKCDLLDGKWVYFHIEPGASTNGVRFWQSLKTNFSERSLARGYVLPDVVYANVDASPVALILYKIFGAKTILRVDGVYSEKPAEFVFDYMPLYKKISLKVLVWLAKKLEIDKDAKLFNFLHRNSSIFLKLYLSDFIVYQSQYSRLILKRMGLERAGTVILNGASNKCGFNNIQYELGSTLKLITIFSGGQRSNKRQSELFSFISWLKVKKNLEVELTILGLDEENLPLDLDKSTVNKMKDSKEFRFLGAFDLAGNPNLMSCEMLNANIYITFTYRDPCPNAVVEAQSFGLPVLALASGGVKEIVGDGGELVPIDDFPDGHLWSNLSDKEYPKIYWSDVYQSLVEITKSFSTYQQRARVNFLTHLDMSTISKQYLHLLKRF